MSNTNTPTITREEIEAARAALAELPMPAPDHAELLAGLEAMERELAAEAMEQSIT